MPNADPRHALAFSIPVDTRGLRFLCRDSVAASGNPNDHPLSSRFDEQDAFVIFDDVEVPRTACSSTPTSPPTTPPC